MRVIAITGGIGSGKTTVARWIRETGVPVIDADQISRHLTKPGGEALPKLREAFGSAIFSADGTLNRSVLAALVFTDRPAPREKLNAILHPMIFKHMQRELKALERRNVPVAVVEVPLLYESGMDRIADTVICVSAAEETRIHRMAVRDGISRKQAVARMKAQQDPQKIEELADYVLRTDAPMHENKENVLRLWQQILSESGE